jgi:putative serine/threonine protein kinase
MAEIMALTDDRPKKALSYPNGDGEVYSRTVRELEGIGVEGIISAGDLEIGGIKVLGKGCVGIVLAGVLGRQSIALKVLRTDANRPSLMNEGRLLTMANGCRAGPQIIAAGANVLAMEYVHGKPLVKWLGELHTPGEVKSALRELLRQARCLDEIGLDHGELSDARKHILIDEKGRPYILDFETASTDRKLRNLISTVGYLFFKSSTAALLSRHITWDRAGLLGAAREYKDAPSKKTYENLITHLGLLD